jgi:hypothetical protein
MSLNVEVNENAEIVSYDIESVNGTPFNLVKFEEGWKIVIGQSIISDRVFNELNEGIEYAKRMDSVDVINAMLTILNTK